MQKIRTDNTRTTHKMGKCVRRRMNNKNWQFPPQKLMSGIKKISSNHKNQ